MIEWLPLLPDQPALVVGRASLVDGYPLLVIEWFSVVVEWSFMVIGVKWPSVLIG